MSTQRREDRWQRTGYAEYADDWSRIWLVFIAFFARCAVTARSKVRIGTAMLSAIARLLSASFGAGDTILSSGHAEAATDSLLSDHQTTQLDRQLFCRASHSSPPAWAARAVIAGLPATRRSSLPLTPAPSGLPSFHPSLPHGSSARIGRTAHIPAGQCRWTERYDGKRDLYFLNAA